MRSRGKFLLFFLTPVALAAPLAVPLQQSILDSEEDTVEILGSSPGFLPGTCERGPNGEILGVDGCVSADPIGGALPFAPVSTFGEGEAVALNEEGSGETTPEDPLPDNEKAEADKAEAENEKELIEEAFWENTEQGAFGMVGPFTFTAGGSGGSLFFSTGSGPGGPSGNNGGPGGNGGGPNGNNGGAGGGGNIAFRTGGPTGEGGTGGGNLQGGPGGSDPFEQEESIPGDKDVGEGGMTETGGPGNGGPGNGGGGNGGGNGGGGNPGNPGGGPTFVEIPGLPPGGGTNGNDEIIIVSNDPPGGNGPKGGGPNNGPNNGPSNGPNGGGNGPGEPEPFEVSEPHGLLVVAAALFGFGLYRRRLKRL